MKLSLPGKILSLLLNFRSCASPDSSKWSTHGVRVGSTLLKLVKLNGKDFSFSGLGWDYGGGVFRNDGGDLSDLHPILDIGDYDQIDEAESVYWVIRLFQVEVPLPGRLIRWQLRSYLFLRTTMLNN
jgi:hypothetical protein